MVAENQESEMAQASIDREREQAAEVAQVLIRSRAPAVLCGLQILELMAKFDPIRFDERNQMLIASALVNTL